MLSCFSVFLEEDYRCQGLAETLVQMRLTTYHFLEATVLRIAEGRLAPQVAYESARKHGR